jgi:UrcA family protein
MNEATHTKTLFPAVLAAATLIAGVSMTARAADAPQVHVKYADLDVNNPAGATMLYQRIRLAATQVCGAPDQRELARFVAAKACADKVIAQAVAAVGNDTLSGVYRVKTHEVAPVKFAAN